ncbi:sigma-54-dependent Fis family transcriptional regulator [Arhodomonas sp. AD133]|uniref:sigma-54-dependent Fis family transcriptional regulator n=1 Tax=Arhodomonas sp. AD133 TaxID=3415009 RepID=UPI003EB8DC24
MTHTEAKHARRVIQAVDRWSRTSTALPEPDDARRVAQSWTRCLSSYGLQPDTTNVEVVLEQSELHAHREELGELFRIARTEMHNLYEQTAGSGYAVILTDARGFIVDWVGDPTLDRDFLDVGLWPGAAWSEAHAGTNGIGTCIEEKRPITIHRDEHYLSCNTALSCSASPIHDPKGNLAAVLDASSVNSRDTRQSQCHTVALVQMSARLIENSNFLRVFHDDWVLRFHVRPEFVGLLNEGMLAINGDGVILAANRSAVSQLGQQSQIDLVGRAINEVLDLSPNAIEERSFRQGQSVWPVHDLRHGTRYFAMMRGPVNRNQEARTRVSTGRVIRPPRSEPASAGLTLNSLMAGGDPRMAYNVRCAERVVDRDVAMLLQGETGTGKEAMARAIHDASRRAEQPFVAVNCAAIPESLIESELFGYKGGAFTGARREGMRGKILQSSAGTLFLDEIGDMPQELQTRLLRVLEQREILPLGAETPIPVDLHVISATHQDLPRLVSEGSFREDLYYRLNGITLQLPALRERRDKDLLIRSALAAESDPGEAAGIDDEAFQRLLAYHWPGNIRQLRNCLRTALALCDGGVIRVADLPPEIATPASGEAASEAASIQPAESTEPAAPASPSASPLECAERDTLLRELERQRWNVTRTATELGVSRNTLYRKMRRHGINPSPD